MNLSKLILDEIKQFNEYVNILNLLISKKYNVDPLQILQSQKQKAIPRVGVLEYDDVFIEFAFHGMGCRFEFNDGVKVDFNYQKVDNGFGYLGFSQYYLFKFILSKIELEQKEFDAVFENLVSQNIIRINEGGAYNFPATSRH